MNRSDIPEEMTANLEGISIKSIPNKSQKEERY